MTGTSGTTSVTTESAAPQAGARLTGTTRAQKISIPTVPGAKCLTTGLSGFLQEQDRTGFPPNRGAGRRITMVAGSFTETAGRGGQDQSSVTRATTRSGRLPMSPSSVSAGLDSEWASASDSDASAGCRVDPATGSILGT